MLNIAGPTGWANGPEKKNQKKTQNNNNNSSSHCQAGFSLQHGTMASIEIVCIYIYIDQNKYSILLLSLLSLLLLFNIHDISCMYI